MSGTCDCCGRVYRTLPPGAWMAYIGGWHTVYISTPNDSCTALGYDNDPAKAAEYAWEEFDKLVERFRQGKDDTEPEDNR